MGSSRGHILKIANKLLATLAVSFGIFLAGNFIVPGRVAAADCETKATYWLGIFPTWYHYLELGTDPDNPAVDCVVISPVDSEKNIDWAKAAPLVGLAVIDIMLRLVGVISVVFVIYGGFNYIMSQGEPDKITSARKTITNSLIGVAISIAAASIVAFIANLLTK